MDGLMDGRMAELLDGGWVDKWQPTMEAGDMITGMRIGCRIRIGDA